MNRRIGVWLVVLTLASCRSYQYEPKLASQGGLVPPDQFARYGKEQAEAVAIGREFARQPDSAVAYARTLTDVVDVHADTQGRRLTVQFKSGWRAGVPPIADGKRGADTPGIGVSAPAKR